MKRCPVIVAVCLASALALNAETVDFTRTFSVERADGLPDGWSFHPYEGYRPQARASVADGVVHVHDVKGRSGSGIAFDKRLIASCGDAVTFVFEAKGRGRLSVFLHQSSKDGNWLGSSAAKNEDLSAEWRELSLTVTPRDGSKPVCNVLPIVEVSSGGEAWIRNLKIRIRHALRFDHYAFSPTRELFADDFESENAARAGSPRLSRVAHTGGLTVATQIANFKASGRTKIASGRFPLPAKGSREYLRAAFRLYSLDADANLGLFCKTEGSAIAEFPLPASARRLRLPADCTIRLGSEGEWRWSCKSLIDGGEAAADGESDCLLNVTDSLQVALALGSAGGKTGTAAIDNLSFGIDRAHVRRMELPRVYSPPASVEPKESGWRCVFADEFEGPAKGTYDKSKWFIPDYYGYKDNGRARLDGIGHLEIVIDYEKGTRKLEAMDLWTTGSWAYGYFEARVRQVRNPGAWSSFWLYSLSHRLPSEDGLELDVYEDGTTCGGMADGVKEVAFCHSMHANYGRQMKSWGCYSRASGSVEDFHTVGCLRTPFGATIYVDGKIVSRDSSGCPATTFDAFREVQSQTPLHAVLSTCVSASWASGDQSGASYPESFLVDWVRVYELPDCTDRLARLAWSPKEERLVIDEGAMVEIGVEPVEAASVSEMYLFDGGAYLAKLTKGPWRFKFPFSRKHYQETQYMAPGRQMTVPDFDTTLHSFTVLARYADGRIGTVAEPFRIVCTEGLKAARGLKDVQKVPGSVSFEVDRDKLVSRVQTGALFAAELDAADDADYEVKVECFSGNDSPNRLLIAVDGRLAGEISKPGRKDHTWYRDGAVEKTRLHLTKGRHRLVACVVGSLSFGPLMISRAP